MIIPLFRTLSLKPIWTIHKKRNKSSMTTWTTSFKWIAPKYCGWKKGARTCY
ncbi:hypothetical protein HanLR1_Chr06g0203281 [Helianthus annuus]|nr:hypothetical protein HanLR1_Chr06g0203281 [Helianthus annuus]